MSDPRVALVAITKHGAARVAQVAPQLPAASIVVSEKFAPAMQGLSNPLLAYQGALSAQIATLFQTYDQIVFFVSLGAVVRLIAPHLVSKEADPGVLVVDDAAQFVIPVLSGHVGGANAYAEQLAALLGAVPVLTTASDVGKTIPVDILGRELGWQVECPKINVTRVSAAVVNEEAVAFVQEAGAKNWWTRPTPLPGNIKIFDRFEEVNLDHFKAVLWVTQRDVPEALWQSLHERLVVYRPPLSGSLPQTGERGKVSLRELNITRRVALGIGCDRNATLQTLQAAVELALAQAGLTHEAVVLCASIDKKNDELALLQLCAQQRWPLQFYSAAELAGVAVPNPSEVVRRYMGTPAVAEAAALLAAHTDMAGLLVEKFKHCGADGKNATVSIARIAA